MRYKIIIADDHYLVSTGVQSILEPQDNFEVLATFSNGKEVLDFCENNRVDIVILDINMPVMNGIKCSKKLKKHFPQIKILILTMYNRKKFVSELMKIGVDGCVQKDKSGEDLIKALNNIVEGKSYFEDEIEVESQVTTQKKASDVDLSQRELEILDLVVNGKTSQEIADLLFISIHTVNTHRKNINRKLNVSGLDELLNKTLELGLLK
ncbi:MAG: response regulator [Lishizhenia sp.]